MIDFVAGLALSALAVIVVVFAVLVITLIIWGIVSIWRNIR